MAPPLPQPLFDALRAFRLTLAKKIEVASDADLDFIPPGAGNSARWNIAHLITTPFLLTYARVGQTLPLLHGDFIGSSRKGTGPGDMKNPALFASPVLSRLLFTSLDQLKTDWALLASRPFSAYETSTGYVLTHLEGALAFAAVHEGIHTGAALARLRAREAIRG